MEKGRKQMQRKTKTREEMIRDAQETASQFKEGSLLQKLVLAAELVAAATIAKDEVTGKESN